MTRHQDDCQFPELNTPAFLRECYGQHLEYARAENAALRQQVAVLRSEIDRLRNLLPDNRLRALAKRPIGPSGKPRDLS